MFLKQREMFILAGFIHDKKAEERIVAKIRQIKGVKSVKSNLKVERKSR